MYQYDDTHPTGIDYYPRARTNTHAHCLMVINHVMSPITNLVQNNALPVSRRHRGMPKRHSCMTATLQVFE